MEMTAVYVEQVIIGAFVLVTVVVLATGALPVIPADMNEIAAGLAFIGAAYVTGILYDRSADTLLERIARWHRISFALERFKPKFPFTADPFPEFARRQQVRPEPLAYFRSRFRILRATASILPAMTIAALVLRQPVWGGVAMFEVAIIYGATAYLSRGSVPPTSKWKVLNRVLRGKLRGRHLSLRRFWSEPALFGLLLIAVLGAGIAATDANVTAASLLLASGLALTLLTAWAWLRVTDTYLGLVYMLAHEKQEAR